MWLRPGFEVYWRGPGASQIGLDPRCALLLEGLEECEQQLLDRLPKCTDPGEFRVLARELGVGAGRVDELLEQLGSAGYLVDWGTGIHPSLRTDADTGYWHRAALAGQARRNDRSAAVVAIHGLDPLGLRLGCALVHAGVGTVVVEDPNRVAIDDVGGGLYRNSDVGRARQDVATTVLRSIDPKVRVHRGPFAGVDVAIMVQAGVVDPVAYRDLMREDISHLPVLVGDLDVVVGPLVHPGVGACLRCLDLYRCDADARWPVVATQAAARETPGAETSLAWMGAALAAHQVLAVVDGRTPVVAANSLEITAWDPVPIVRHWSPHPECGCTPVALATEAG